MTSKLKPAAKPHSKPKSKNRKQPNNSNFMIYLMFTLVITIIIAFWLQLKQEIADNQKQLIAHQSQSTSPLTSHAQPQPHNEQPKSDQPKHNEQLMPRNIQRQEQTSIVEKKEIIIQNKEQISSLAKQILKDGSKPYDSYMFQMIQNWDKKSEIREKFKRDIQENSAPPIQGPRPKSSPSSPNSPTPPTTPQSGSTPESNRASPNTARGSLRAGITAAQLDLAKRLQKAQNEPATSAIAKEEKDYYEQKYKISQYKEQPFCIVVPSYNNTAQNRYINNMNSILMQDYSNYHIVFIDDASEDETGRLMKQYALDHQISEQKLKIIINTNRTMAMPNLYRAAKEFCKPYEIFVIVDGDDELLGRQVLKHFNSLFQARNIWVGYTNFVSIRGSIGFSRPYSQTVIDRNSYRKSGFVISHLRAFYTKLFASVKEEDLQDENRNWFRAANDVAMYMPILQMAHNRITYCPQLSYLYNSNTGLNNHRVKLKQQKGNEKKVKQKPPYNALHQLFTEQEKEELKSSLDRKIPIKDPQLSAPAFEVKKYGWEQ